MEPLDSNHIQVYSRTGTHHGDLPLLFQASPAAIRTLCITYQHRPFESSASTFHAAKLRARTLARSWILLYAGNRGGHQSPHQRFVERRRIPGASAHGIRGATPPFRTRASAVPHRTVFLLFLEPRSKRAHVLAGD